MTSGLSCLIIDDVEEALSIMTPLGREVASGAARTIREAVVDFATRRSWSILRYQAYVDWAADIMSRDDHPWLVLDPLFSVPHLGRRIRRGRVSRRFRDNQAVVDRGGLMDDRGLFAALSGVAGEVGILDDAAASGTTLKYAVRVASQAGATVRKVLVAASSRAARASFRAAAPTARWSEFVRGDWETVHLRDGCPHLPYSGRATAQSAIVGVDGGSVEVRVPSSRVLGNLWQVLTMDPKVRGAVFDAQSEIARMLSGTLGRPACIRDLSMMGSFVPVLAKNGELITGETTLESLLERPRGTGPVSI